jgi:excinuclease ABC subunit C
MNRDLLKNLNIDGESSGVFALLDENGRRLFVGVFESIESEIKRIFAVNRTLKSKTSSIEIIKNEKNDLVNHLAASVADQNPVYNFSLRDQKLHPHIKVTNEKFPRLLATRRIENDGAEYFGAFLPKTGARYLIGFLIDAFRLRGCDIEINGDFPVPCPQFYRKNASRRVFLSCATGKNTQKPLKQRSCFCAENQMN